MANRPMICFQAVVIILFHPVTLKKLKLQGQPRLDPREMIL